MLQHCSKTTDRTQRFNVTSNPEQVHHPASQQFHLFVLNDILFVLGTPV